MPYYEARASLVVARALAGKRAAAPAAEEIDRRLARLDSLCAAHGFAGLAARTRALLAAGAAGAAAAPRPAGTALAGVIVEVDVDRGEIRVGAEALRRPVLASMLAHLGAADGHPRTAAELFRCVWAGEPYHPLNHASRIYTAIGRLRALLSHWVADPVETCVNGWRLAPGVAVRRTASLSIA